MRGRVVGGILVFLALATLVSMALYKMPETRVTGGSFKFESFRETIWVGYGLAIVVLSLITSIVMIASVFAFRVSEGIGGGE